jgi:hypothetical protein
MSRPGTLTHRVRQGECFRSIAAAYGVEDWRELYDHPDNAGLRAQRTKPHQLVPGDRVVVPAPPARSPLSFSSGGTVRYQAQIPLVPLRLQLAGTDLAGAPYVLEVGGRRFEATVPADGLIEHEVSPLDKEGVLRIEGDPANGHGLLVLPLAIGHLDPVDVVTGVQGRLNNLGFPCPRHGRLDRATRAAIRAFRLAEGLSLGGGIDDALRARLVERHESASGEGEGK